jgi:hypothetical protein
MPRMKKISLAAVLLMAAAGVAQAGGQEGSIGVGAEVGISGQGGVSVNYDAGMFHAGGFLFLTDGAGDDNTDFGIGGRFYYHLHSTAQADFGVGGQIAFVSLDGPGDRASGLFIEPGFQARFFVVPNVALSLSGGLAIGAIDADGIALTGQLTGAAGFHYYFF